MGSGKTEQRTHCIHPIDENAKSLFSLVTNITRHGKYVCYGIFIGSRCKWNFVHWNRTKCCQPYARLCLNIRHIHSKWYPWSLTTGSPTWNYSTIHTEVDNLCGPLPALLGILHTACTYFIISLDILILFHVLLYVYTKNYHRSPRQTMVDEISELNSHSLCVFIVLCKK